MIKEEIKIFDNQELLNKGFTDFFQKALEIYPQLNISLSGGSTPKTLFEYWAKNCQTTIDWERIYFFWGDERCVPPESERSNYGMTKEFLFDKISNINYKHVHRIHGENEAQEEAQWYNKVLSHTLQRNNRPCLEIIMLGLGEDGHTASIFPDHIDLWDSPESCVVTRHPQTGIERISMTGKIINNAQNVVFFVAGKNKAEIVRDIIKNREKFYTIYPATRVDPAKGFLYWFLDKEAASLL